MRRVQRNSTQHLLTSTVRVTGDLTEATRRPPEVAITPAARHVSTKQEFSGVGRKLQACQEVGLPPGCQFPAPPANRRRARFSAIAAWGASPVIAHGWRAKALCGSRSMSASKTQACCATLRQPCPIRCANPKSAAFLDGLPHGEERLETRAAPMQHNSRSASSAKLTDDLASDGLRERSARPTARRAGAARGDATRRSRRAGRRCRG
jgi:hypothetical protein